MATLLLGTTIGGYAAIHAGNIGSQSVNYANTSGSTTGSAGSVVGLTLNSSANGINPDNVTQNQLGYNTSVSLFGQTDGGLYSSAYNSNWVHQIYGDFRTGQIAVRGKNSGTWQGWRRILDETNFSSWAATAAQGTKADTAFGWGNHASAGYATTSYVTTQIANLVASAPAALDTLNELAAALGNDASFSTTVSTALGNRLRVDTAVQGLTSTQQSNARTNLGLGSLATLSSIGNSYITDLAWSKITGAPSFLTSYSETDTLATVVARGATTTSSITINKSGTLISHSGMTDAIGYNPSYGTYIGSTVGATYYLYANGTFNDAGTMRTLIHSGNIGSQSVNYASSAGSVAWTNVTGRPTNVSSFTNDSGYITGGYLSDFTSGNLRFIADYGSNTTWFIRSNGQFIFGNAHDWTQSFRLNLNHDSTDNGTWAYFGQQDSNATNGRYRGVRIRKYAGGAATDGDLSAGAFYIGTTRKDTNWDTAYSWGNHASAGYLTSLPSHNHDASYVPLSRTITINGTAYDLSADRSWTVGGSDATKLPLAGGTMTGILAFSNTTGNKIDFYYTISAGVGDRYGIQVQNSELRIHSGAQGVGSGGITFGKSDSNTFTEAMRVRNDGLIAVVNNLVVGSQQGYDNPGGWNKNILIDGTNHGRFRIKASNYTYGNIEVYLWADSSVSPSHGIYGSNAVFSFGGSITSLTVSGNTVLHAGNYNSYSPTLTGGGASGTWGINVTGSSRSLLFSGDSAKALLDGLWAGGGSYPGYQFTGGNSRFGFSSTGGVVDVYADGNFYATDSSYLVWHAGNAPRANYSNLMYYAGFTLDANTMPSNSTGFTYSVNAPYTGPIAKFSEDGYPLQLNATYSGGTSIAYRTRNGDAGSWNSWYAFITSANIGSQSVSYASSAGSASTSSQVTINYNNDSNSTYQLLWGSGNSVYGTSQVYVNPYSDVIYARGGYISPGNPWGTADSAYFPNGITTAGSDNWIYGHTYIGNAPGNGNGHEFWADGSMRSTRHHYLDANYGQTIVGRYSSTVYQGVWAMGDSYKLPIDGSTTGSLYGLAWSHPNAGGVAGNLNTHGLLVMENGTFLAAISGNIKSRDSIISGAHVYANSGYFYGSGSIRCGDMWGGAGLYRPSGSMVFGIENSDWVFSKGAVTQAYFGGGDGNLWMRWAGDWLSNLLGAKAVHRGEGSNYVDYSRYVYNNGAYSGSGWIEPSDLGVRYAGTAGYCSGRSELLSSMGASFNDTHPGYGARVWYDWAYSGTYRNGISIGSHPGDTYYGWQIYQNMWDDRTYTRRYNGGWQSVRTLLSAEQDPYAYNMNQYVRTYDGPTFSDVYLNGWFRNNGNNTGLYNQSNGNHFYSNGGGSWAITGNGGNVELQFRSNHQSTLRGYVYGDTSSNFGLLNDQGGWSVRCYSGAGYGGYLSGSWTASGDLVAYSDARVKENVETIENALSKILSMRGVTYNRTDIEDKSKKVGVIAQEVQAILPEVVTEQQDGMLGVSYGNIVGVLIEAIKEQQKEIEVLKSKLN